MPAVRLRKREALPPPASRGGVTGGAPRTGGATPSMTDLVLLAVTRMLSGVCIGGAPPGGGPWVRPVKSFGCPQLGDIRYADGTLMGPFDIVSLNLLKSQPDPPHVEDVLCD